MEQNTHHAVDGITDHGQHNKRRKKNDDPRLLRVISHLDRVIAHRGWFWLCWLSWWSLLSLKRIFFHEIKSPLPVVRSRRRCPPLEVFAGARERGVPSKFF